MFDLRPARMHDGDLLLSWRNDPGTLAAFRSTTAVSQEEHQRWMEFNVGHGYPTHLVMIAETDDFGSVGVVRFDAARNDVLNYEVSITVAPEYRHRGFGMFMLAQACSMMDGCTLHAEIRSENTGSRRIFERCGFRLQDVDSYFARYKKEQQ